MYEKMPWLSLSATTSTELRQARRLRQRRQADWFRPRLVYLEERRLLTCTYPEPWCLDAGFASASSRHAVVNIGDHLALGRAVHLQTVDGEQRILIAGSAVDPNDPTNPKFAIARLCADGTLDNGINCGAGSQNGFGPHGSGGADAAPGFVIKDFFDLGSPPAPDEERADAIAIQPNNHSDFCDGPNFTDTSDKILVTGRVLRNVAPVRYHWGVMRLCENGEIDLDFGGQPRDYDVNGNTSDEPGTVTIAHADGIGGWTRDSEPFAMLVEPNTNKIVIGGYAAFPPPPNPRIDEFSLARLCEDGTFDNGDLGTLVGNCGSEGLGLRDQDPGRIRFDGFKSSPNGTYVDNDRTDSRIRGLQLAPALNGGTNKYDILIAGQTRHPTQNQSDFFIARVKHDGDRAFAASSTQWNPFHWKKTIDFGNQSFRNDFAFDVAYSPSENAIIVVGVTCPLGACANLEIDPSQPSDIAFMRLNAVNGNVTYKERVTGGADEFATTFTDVAYSVVILSDDDDEQGDNDDQGGDDQGDDDDQGGDEFFVVGGYSVDADGGVSYMSGARFGFNNPDANDYNFFRSDFANSAGDQARELQVQDDNRIVAGGFHTETGAASFAAIRLCENPADDCNLSNASSGGDGGGTAFGFGWGDVGLIALSSDGQPVGTSDPLSGSTESPESPTPALTSTDSDAPAPAPVVDGHQVSEHQFNLDELFDSPLSSEFLG